MRRLGLSLITLVALFTMISPILADWNDTHVYNPGWPPHAKFHLGQTMASGVILGLFAIAFAWAPTAERRLALLASAGFAVAYWLAQAFALLIPGSSYVDPQFAESFPKVLGIIAPQQILQIVCTLLVGVGVWLAWPRRSAT